MPHNKFNIDADPHPIFDVLLMPYAFISLSVAVLELDLFTKLNDTPLPIERICQLTGIQERPIRILLRSFMAIGLLEQKDGNFCLTRMAEVFLVKNKPYYLGDIFAGQVDYPVTYKNFKKSIIEGKPSIYSDSDIFTSHKKNPEQTELFTKVMHVRSIINGASLVKKFDFSPFHQVVDIGGGSGGISIMISLNNPHISASIFDMPNVCKVAERIISEFGLSDRIESIPGDLFHDNFTDAFPEKTDLVIFSRILHDWNADKCEYLLRQAYDVLPKGGAVLIVEALLDGAETVKFAPFWENLAMLLWTEGEHFTCNELETHLLKAGFGNISIKPIYSGYSLISAYKL